MRQLHGVRCVLIVLLAIGVPSLRAQYRYTVKKLRSFYPVAVNDAGHVAGYTVKIGDPYEHAVLYKHGLLTASWSNTNAANDYAAINHGQLKNLARLFYDRLAEVGYTGRPLRSGEKYPWSSLSGDDLDYTAANIG